MGTTENVTTPVTGEPTGIAPTPITITSAHLERVSLLDRIEAELKEIGTDISAEVAAIKAKL